jgi:predicted RND superfamily exporter protein
MAALGIPINVMTTIVPVLLIIIGSTEDIHLISEYYHGVESGYERKRAVLRMVRLMTLAVMLTFLTSGLGFLATGLNPIQMVREFAIVSASGLAINFLVTVLLVPLLLRYLGEAKTTRGFSTGLPRIGLGEKMATFALNNRAPLAIITGIVMLTAMLLSSGINVNNSYLQYFDEQSDIRREANLLHEKLSGLETFNIIVDGHIDGTFERVNYLNELVKIQNYLRDRPSFDFTLSVADYIATVNSTVNDSGDLELPEEDEVVESLLLFVKKEQLAHYVTEDFSRANIVVRHNLSASADLNRELSYLRNHIDSVVDKDLKTTITGSSILSSHASDFLAESQAKSLAFMLVVIFIVIAIMFVDVKAGLLAVIPNIFVAACLFGIMGALGIPLDTGTSTIAAIALGISVDHTMHFLVRYQKIAKTTKSKQQAITQAASIELRPVAAATVSLAAGFATLTLSGFTPVQYFGALSATVMLLAFYANFTITPLLLSYVRLITLWDMLSVPVRRGLKTQCTLFKGMNEFQIRHVLALGKIENYPVNSVIYAASRREKQLFVLLKGQVLVNPREESQQALRDDGTTDSIFGTGSMIDGWPHQCHVEVTEESQILALDWDRLSRIQRFRPRTGSILFKNLSVILARLVEVSNPTNTLSSAKESNT